MKRWVLPASGLALAIGLFTAASSWSDTTSPVAGPSAGSAAAVDLGNVPYSALSPAEQAVIDHGRAEQGWDAVNAGFASATIELSATAAANAAANQLGMDNLGQVGVVP
jgi:hypothetical protein